MDNPTSGYTDYMPGTLLSTISLILGTVFIYFKFNNLTDITSKNTSLSNTKYNEHLYEYKYIERLKELSADEDNTNQVSDEVLLNLCKLYIVEETPVGTVIMCYNTQSESFCYYSDNKNVPYKYLETVARLYVIQNKCRIIYTHMPDELNNAKERLINDMEAEKKKLNNQDNNDVFVQFKSYNIANNPKQNKKTLVKENANRYSYRGTLADYAKMTDKLKINENKALLYKDIDFATFKKKHS